MSIAIIINELDICGGTHKQVLRLAQYLHKSEIEFELITKSYDPSSTYPEFKQFVIKRLISVKGKSPVEQATSDKIKTRINVLKLIRIISSRHRILNFHDNGYGFSLMMFLFKILGRTIIWQINDLPPCFLEGNSKLINDNFRFSINRLWYRIVAKYFVDEITVNVSKNAERIKKHFNREASVFYCGTDMLQNMPRIKKRNNKLTILTSGVFFPYRNYTTQLKVIHKLISLGIDCELNIVGSTKLDPIYHQQICDMANSLKISTHINIHGQVSDDFLLHLHNISDVFIFINIDQSWGLAVFEAMSVGLPVIVSESIGAVELLTNNVDSIIVDPLNVVKICEEIIKLMNDEKHYLNISSAAYNKVLGLTWDKMYSTKMLSIFNQYERV